MRQSSFKSVLLFSLVAIDVEGFGNSILSFAARARMPLTPTSKSSKVHLKNIGIGSRSRSNSIGSSHNLKSSSEGSLPIHALSSTRVGGSASSSEDEPSKCPVTIFSNKVTSFLGTFDSIVLCRIIRIANHVPALMSLSYFGLISMASMMSMGPMAPASCDATLSAVLTRTVGPTTNAAFASLFPTLVTPASFVFLVWPLIAVLQLVTVSVSALFPPKDEFLSQNDLSALTVANLCSAAWLFASSNAMAGSLPIASFLVLPLVPIFSGYPLRNKPKYVLWAYQVYSAFTTLASILAFTVEIQHGGRIPIIGKVSAEVAASIFLTVYSTASLAVKKKSGAKKLVNFGALTGILVRRFSTTLAGGIMSGLGSLLLSVSFLGTVGCWYWALDELFTDAE